MTTTKRKRMLADLEAIRIVVMSLVSCEVERVAGAAALVVINAQLAQLTKDVKTEKVTLTRRRAAK